MEQTILTEHQQTVLELVAKEERLHGFYLSGGTALAAFYLKHRYSDDLDFFTQEMPDVLFLRTFAKTIRNTIAADNVQFEHLYDRNIFTFTQKKEEIKIEFTKYPFPQLESLSEQNGVKVDSFRDIAANKLAALLDRFDPKDFADLYFILQKTTLKAVWHDTEQKFGMNIDPVFLGSELAKVRRIEGLPRMVKSLNKEELREFFTEEAKKLSPSIFLS